MKKNKLLLILIFVSVFFSYKLSANKLQWNSAECMKTWTRPMLAVYNRNYLLLDSFIRSEIDINAYDTVNEQNSLGVAIYNKDVEMMKFLIQRGGNINAKINDRTLFFEADIRGNRAVMELLLINGIDISFRDSNNNTAIFYVIKSDTRLLKLLLRYNINLDVTNKQGETPFSYSLKSKNYKAYRIMKRYQRSTNRLQLHQLQ